MGLSIKIIDHDKNEIAVDATVNKYYSNPENHFEYASENFNNSDLTLPQSEHNRMDQPIENDSFKTGTQTEYMQNSKICRESSENTSRDVKNKINDANLIEKLFEDDLSNNFITQAVPDDMAPSDRNDYTYDDYARDFGSPPKRPILTDRTNDENKAMETKL